MPAPSTSVRQWAALLLAAVAAVAAHAVAAPAGSARLELHNRGKAPFVNSGADAAIVTGLTVGRRGAGHLSPGSLAFFSVVESALVHEWVAEIRVGAQVERLERGRFIVQGGRGYATVMIASEGPLHVRLHPSVAAIRLEGTTNPVPLAPQQVFGETELAFLGDSGNDARTEGMLRAVGRLIRVRVVNEVMETAETCTAFHIGRGHWFTNAHCLEPGLRCARPQALQPSEMYLLSWMPGAGAVDQQAPAQLLAAGCSEKDAPRPLIDYAAFRVAASMRAASMAIVSADAQPGPNDDLELFQFWPGAEGLKEGRAVSRDRHCRVVLLSGTTEANGVECALNGFAHKCDTTEGSSGSPLFLRGKNAVIGLHYGYNGPSYNCAVKFSEVVSSIRKDFPAIATDILP